MVFTSPICLVDVGELDDDEKQIIRTFRAAKRRLAENVPAVSFNRNGSRRKRYTSTRRRLSSNYGGLKKLRRSMDKAVRVLPLLAACCFLGVLSLHTDVEVAQSTFGALSVADK